MNFGVIGYGYWGPNIVRNLMSLEGSEVRAIAGAMPFLVPGVGAQGADVRAAIEAGQSADGRGLIVSSSRSIIHASSGADFAAAARAATILLRDQVNAGRRRDVAA